MALTNFEEVLAIVFALLTFASIVAIVGVLAALFSKAFRKTLGARDRRSVLVARLVGIVAAITVAMMLPQPSPRHLRPEATAYERANAAILASDPQWLKQEEGARTADFIVRLLLSMPGAYLLAAVVARVVADLAIRGLGITPQGPGTEHAPTPKEQAAYADVIRRRYAGAETNDLTRLLAEGGLTEIAHQALLSEMERRGVSVQATLERGKPTRKVE